MTNNKAQEIIERAMTDRTVYDAMAARESEVWGKILPALERSEARAADATARDREAYRRAIPNETQSQ